MGTSGVITGDWESLIQPFRLSDRRLRPSGMWPGSQLRGHPNKPKSWSDPQVHGGLVEPQPPPRGLWDSGAVFWEDSHGWHSLGRGGQGRLGEAGPLGRGWARNPARCWLKSGSRGRPGARGEILKLATDPHPAYEAEALPEREQGSRRREPVCDRTFTTRRAARGNDDSWLLRGLREGGRGRAVRGGNAGLG